MLVDGVHGDQGNFPLLAGLGAGGLGGGAALLGEHGHAGVGDRAAQALAVDGLNCGLYALVTHDVGVLGHGGQQIAVVDEAQDGVGLVKAHADDVGLAGGLDGVARAGGGALVAAEDAHHALGDVVLGDGLGLGGVALAVLGLQQLEAGALEGGAEALLTHNAGVGGGVHVDDAHLAGGDALGLQGLEHLLAGGLASGLVVGGEGGLGVHVGGGVHVDDLHALVLGLLQSGGDGVGAVGGHDDGLGARADGVVNALDLLGVVLGVGGHELYVDPQLTGRLLGALVQGDPVLVDGVHGDQRDHGVRAGALAGVVLLGAARHGGDHQAGGAEKRCEFFHFRILLMFYN